MTSMPERIVGTHGAIVQDRVFIDRPEFAILVATVLQLWNEIDYELADLVFSDGRRPAEVTVRDYFSVFTIRQRLDRAERAVEDTPFSDELRVLRPGIEKLAAERAQIAHGRWAHSPEHPGALLLLPHAGERYYREKDTWIYRESDFHDLMVRLSVMRKVLGQLDSRFRASLRPKRA